MLQKPFSSDKLFLTIRSVLADQTGSTGSPQADGLETAGETPTITGLAENLAHNVSVHVGQAVVAALKLEGQPGVIYSQAMQHSGMQVVDIDSIPHDVVTEVVRFTVVQAALDTPPAIQTEKQRG